MNLENLFYTEAELNNMPDAQAIHCLAVNELGEWGFIIKVENLNGPKVYIGFGLRELSEWVALKPLITKNKVDFHAAAEIASVLEEVAMMNKKNPKEVQVRISALEDAPGGPILRDIMGGAIPLNDKDSLQKFMQKFLFPDMPGQPPQWNNDFKIESDDNDNDDDNNE